MLNKILCKALRVPGSIPGYLRALRQLRSRSVAIVMYHGVAAQPLPVFNWSQLALEDFDRQMRFLSTEYTVLPLAEVQRRLESGAALPGHTACITFDDGFRNVYTTAYPVLERYQLPATVFLVTSVVGTRRPAWPEIVYHAIVHTRCASISFQGTEWPLATTAQRSAAHVAITSRLKSIDVHEKERLLADLLHALGTPPPIEADSPVATMDWAEIEQLSRAGLVDFGSHTHTHPILSRCPEEMQFEELRISRDILRERLGAATLFAYPNGTRADFTGATKRLVAELKYRCAVSTVPGLNSAQADPYELHRINVGAGMGFRQFEAAMVGL